MICGHTQKNQDGSEGGKTFRLIPITNESIILMGEFDLGTNKLVLSLREKTGELTTIPSMDKDGSYISIKNPKSGASPVQMERRVLDTWHEIHLSDVASIDEFLKLTCVNSESYPYQQYLAKIETEDVKKSKIITLS